MLSFIIIVLVLASLARRPFFSGFPFFLSTRHYHRRPPFIGGFHRPPMGGPHGMHHGPHGMGGPHGWF